MRTNKSIYFALIITSSLACVQLLADVKKPESPPSPLSGLNLEDFKSAAENEVEWESNPFVKYGDSLQAKQLVLFGIIFSPGRSIALINSEIVRVGEKVGASQVVAIEKQKVVLRNGDGLYEISFRGVPNEKT